MPNGLTALPAFTKSGKLTLAGASALLAAGVLGQRALKKRRVSKKKGTKRR